MSAIDDADVPKKAPNAISACLDQLESQELADAYISVPVVRLHFHIAKPHGLYLFHLRYSGRGVENRHETPPRHRSGPAS